MADQQQTAVLTVILNGEQAAKELHDLKIHARDTAAQIDKLRKGGDNAQADQLAVELKETNKAMNQLRKETVDVNKVLSNLSTAKPQELSRALTSLQRKLNNKDIERGSEEWNTLNESIRKVREEIRKVSDESKIASKELSSVPAAMGNKSSFFLDSMKVFAGNVLTKVAAGIGLIANQAVEFVKQGIEVANEAEGIRTAFEKLGNSGDLLKGLRSETKGLISDLQLMTLSVKAKNFDIPLDSLGRLLKFAQQRAQETGESVDYLANSIIAGLGRKSPLILDNLGISAAKLQAEVKRTGDFSTAAIGLINEELKKQGDLALTSADKATQAAVKWENAQLKVGQRFQWIGRIWNEVSSGMADIISRLAGESKTANQALDDQIEKSASLNVNILPLIDRYEEMSKSISLTHDQAFKLNPEQEEMLSIIESIAEAIPSAVSGFDQWGRVIGLNTQKARDFVETQAAMLQYMNKSAISETQKNIDKKKSELEGLYRQKEKGIVVNAGTSITGYTQSYTRERTPEESKALNDEIAKAELYITGAKERLKQLNGDVIKEQRAAIEERMKMQNEFNAMTKQQLDAWIKNEENAKNKHLDIARQLYDAKFGGNTDTLKPKDDSLKKAEESLRKEIEAEEERYKQSQINLKNDLLNKQITQETFDKEMEKRAADHLENLKEINKKGGKSIADIENKILDKRIKEAQELQKEAIKEALRLLDEEQAAEEARLAEKHRKGLITEGAYKEALLKMEASFLQKKKQIQNLPADQLSDINEKLSLNAADRSDSRAKERKKALSDYGLDEAAPEDVYEASLKVIEDLEARGVLTHEEATAAKRVIDEEYFEALVGKAAEASEKIQNVTSNLTTALSGFQQAEEMAVTRKYDKMIDNAEGNAEAQEKLEKEKEAELNRIRAEYADKQFIVKAASIGASTAVAAMEAYAAMAGIPVVGPALGALAAGVAIAAGAAQIAVANQERENAKAGYYSGGFTPSGPWDKPVGVVHSEEFVGNRFSVRNPVVRKVFNIVDEAQRNNTVSSLSEKDFARALDYREAENRIMLSGIRSAVAPPDDSGTDALVPVWIENAAGVIDKLNKRLDEPFTTVNTVTGRYGMKRAFDNYDKIQKNKNRS